MLRMVCLRQPKSNRSFRSTERLDKQIVARLKSKQATVQMCVLRTGMPKTLWLTQAR